MKLTLTNFGIHASKTIDIPLNKLTLLHGSSGSGKTTIFRAINYALSGEGTKLPSFGHTSCSVILEYNNIVVKRTNSPRRLIVIHDGISYEGDEAQSILNENMKHFGIAGYIQQKGENSFLAMSSSEKLVFLENIAFNGKVEEIRNLTRDAMKKTDVLYNQIQGELRQITSNPVQEPKTPELTVEDVEQLKREFVKLREELILKEKDLKTSISSHEAVVKTQEIIKNKLQAIRIIDVPDIIADDSLITYQSLRKDEIHKKKIYSEYLMELKSLESITSYLQTYDTKVCKLKDKITNFSITHFTKELENELMELEGYLVQYRKQEYNKKLLKEFNKDRYLHLQSSIPLHEDKLRLYKLTKDTRECPKCKVHLRFSLDKLEIMDDVKEKYDKKIELSISNELTSMKVEYEELRKKHDVITSLQVDVKDVKEEIEMDEKEVVSRIQELKAQKLKNIKELSDLKVLDVELANLLNDKSIEKMRARSVPIEVYDTTETQYEGSVLSLNEIVNMINTIKKKNVERIKIMEANVANEKMFKELESQLIPIDNTLIDSYKTSLQEIRDTIETNLKVYMKVEPSFQESYTYKIKKESYDKYITSLEKTTETFKIAETNLTNTKKFHDCVLKAEMLALNGLIDEINTHLSEYLELFFPDNPITMELSLFKCNDKTKTVKSQVNIKVGYRGTQTELSVLSGGERDRVNLAFTLALSEILNLKLILLDETLSSLDRETTENILESISREDRQIIMIAHQVSHGMFDNIIDITS